MWFAFAWASQPQQGPIDSNVSEVVVTIRDDDSVVGSAVVSAPLEHVRAKLADPVWIASVDNSGNTVTVTATEPCPVSSTVTPSAFKTVLYSVKRCPTSDGFHETLVESNTFDAYEVRWTLEPADGGTRITYEIATETHMMVPQFVINRATRNGVERMLVSLQATFAEAS